MDEHKLRCFVAVYEEESVSAAAARMHMTQPPLSILLRKLEGEFGVALFDRSGYRLAPTSAGELFYLRAKALLADFQTLRRELREVGQGARGMVQVGCSTAASLFIMPHIIESLERSGSQVTVHVNEGEVGYMLQRLRERSLDLIICRSEYLSPELESRVVMDEPLLVALPRSHPLAGRDCVPLGELRHERFLLHRSPLGTGISDMVLRGCQRAGYVPNVVYWGGETLPMLLMANRGQGVAFAPQSFAQLGTSNLPALLPLDDEELRTRLHLVWPRHHPLSPVASRIKDLILAHFSPSGVHPGPDPG